MKKTLIKGVVSIMFVAGLMFFSVPQNIFAHDECCEKVCDKCPMCDFFSEEGLVTKSKEELLKMKEIIQDHLTKENMVKLGEKAIKSLEKSLATVNEKLENIAETKS